jgi:hypothetical protein
MKYRIECFHWHDFHEKQFIVWNTRLKVIIKKKAYLVDPEFHILRNFAPLPTHQCSKNYTDDAEKRS